MTDEGIGIGYPYGTYGRYRYFHRVPGGTERTPVFREAGTEGYRAYPGISRSQYRVVPSVLRYFAKPVPGGTGRTPVFQGAGTGGYRAYSGISRGRYRGVPSVRRYFEKPVPGVPHPYRDTGTGPVPADAGIAVRCHSDPCTAALTLQATEKSV